MNAPNKIDNDDILSRAALTHLREKRLPQAQVMVGQWLQRAPRSAHAQALHALIMLASGSLEQALEAANKSLAADAHCAVGALAMGQCLLAQEQVEQAKNQLQRGHHLDPNNPDIALPLVQIYFQQDKNEEAQSLLRPFVHRTEPACNMLRLMLAELWLNQRPCPLPELHNLLQALCQQAPELASAWAIHGLVLAQRGDKLQAKKLFTLALQLEPEHPGLLLSHAQLIDNDEGSTQSEREQAIEQAQNASLLNPHEWRAPWIQARLERKQGLLAAAVQSLSNASQSFDAEPQLWFELARNLSDLGQSEAAQEALEKFQALETDPRDVLRLSIALLMRQSQWAQAHSAQEALDAQMRGQDPRMEVPVEPKSREGKTWFLSAETHSELWIYARFISEFQQRSGAQILLAAPAPQVALLQRVPGVLQVTSTEQVQAHGFEPISRLPMLLGRTDTSVDWPGPYLPIDPSALAQAKQWRAAQPTPSVLIDMGPEPAPLLVRRLGHLLSERQARVWVTGALDLWQAAAPQANVLQANTEDLDMLCAHALQADLVVGCDNATAWLLGALGVPAQITLNLVHDPLWGKEETRSAWCPSLQIHREPPQGGWLAQADAWTARMAALLDSAAPIHTRSGGQALHELPSAQQGVSADEMAVTMASEETP
jgi:tetratricopeptide (TPR) repeat protein